VKTKSSKTAKKTAFSIVELSIVALIISALIGTIISANRMLFNSKLSTAQTLTKSSPVNDIDNLALWYETTMPKSFDDLEADNNKAVTTWYDLSPNKVNATSAGAPKYMTDVVNGLPVIRFAGTATDYLTFDGSAIVNSNYTVFTVDARRGTPNFNTILGGTGTSAFQNFHHLYYNSTTFRIAHYGDGSAGIDYINYTIPGYVSPIFQIKSTTFSSSVGRSYYENGTLRSSITSSGAKTPIASWVGSAIGRFTTNYFTGDIAEIIIFNRALTKTERKDVEQYLGAKWDITPIGTD
jgi:hypothetical protein